MAETAGVSENDVDTVIEDCTGQGTISRFNAIGPGETLSVYEQRIKFSAR